MTATHAYRMPLRTRAWIWTWPARDWLAQIWFCHHNARVIIDFERRMSAVLCECCTRGMSKPYYTAEAMRGEINAFINDTYDDGYEEGLKETQGAYNAPLNFALDVEDDPCNALTFLRLWREGDYDTLTLEWPEWAIQVANPEVRK